MQAVCFLPGDATHRAHPDCFAFLALPFVAGKANSNYRFRRFFIGEICGRIPLETDEPHFSACHRLAGDLERVLSQ
jgi:hypothetical protein